MPHLEMDNRPCCPKCQSRLVKVDNEKGFFDFLYTLVMQRPVKCRKCRHRFGAFWDPTAEVVGFEKKRKRKKSGPVS